MGNRGKYHFTLSDIPVENIPAAKPKVQDSPIEYKPTAFDKAWNAYMAKILEFTNKSIGAEKFSPGLYSAKPKESSVVNKSKFKSQKAKGIHHLTSPLFYTEEFAKPKAKFYPYDAITKFPVFARPCPTVPRHGFVDSRVIHNQEEFTTLEKEIEATGEPIEIVCMEFIPADYSGIVTPNGVTFGKGNDGATSGTSAKYIPCTASPEAFNRELCFTNSDIGIQSPDVAYGEFVGLVKEEKPTLVQLRGGPSVGGSTRYVPVDTEVTAIEIAEGDLLEWETKVKTFGPGTVVFHPNGALSSHYAVHCILNKIPVICGNECPKVGTIVRAENAVPELKAADYTVLAQYLATAINQTVSDPYRTGKLETAVATLHSQTLWGNEDHLLQLRAFGAAATFRYAAAACFGELRHARCHGPDQKLETPIPWESCSVYSRDFVFMQIYRHNIRAILEACPAVVRDYEKKGWSHSFGGKKWAACAKAVLRLGQGIQHFLHHKNRKTWNELVAGWNETINAVHNGGGLLTKHISGHFLGRVAVTPFVGFINTFAVSVALGWTTLDRNKKPGKVLPLNSRKPALELYPFINNVPKFKKVLEDSRNINGLFEVEVCKCGYDDTACYLKFPYVTTTSDHTNPLTKQSYCKVLHKALGTKQKVKAKFRNGNIQYIVIGGIIHKAE